MKLYIGSWERGSGAGYVARHNLDEARYQQDFNDLPRQGYRPFCVSGGGDDTGYSSLWEKRTGPAWVARHGMSASDYQKEFTALAGQGYRLRCINGYSVRGKSRFAALWDKSAGPAWIARHGLTASEYQQQFEENAKQGYRPTWITVYADGPTERYAGIWEKSVGKAWVVRHNIGAEEYKAYSEDRITAGWRLVCGNGCAVGARDVYASLWEDAPAGQWASRHALTADDYQRVFDKLTRAGFQPRYVASYSANRREKFAREAVIAWQSDWAGIVQPIADKLAARGYVVSSTDRATDAVAGIDATCRRLRAGDRLFVYLGCHGGQARQSLNDPDPRKSLNHAIETNYGIFVLRDIVPMFETAANRGVEVSVLDGSCNGGETVLAATGQRYAAASIVGIFAPSLTGSPNPATEFRPTDPDCLGHWWNPNRTMASRLNAQFRVLRPDRVAQKVLRNDDCDAARNGLFWQAAISAYGVGNAWEMGKGMYWCHLYRYVFKEAFDQMPASDQAQFTLSAEGFITGLKRDALAPTRAWRERYNAFLANQALNKKASQIYAAHYKQAWLSVGYATDLWGEGGSVFEQFGRKTRRDDYWRRMFVYPNQYAGIPGFHRMVADLVQAMAQMEHNMEVMFDLFRRIERAAKTWRLVDGVRLKDRSPRLTMADTLDALKQYNAVQATIYARFEKLQVAKQLQSHPLAGKVKTRSQFIRLQRESLQSAAEALVGSKLWPMPSDKSVADLVKELHVLYLRQTALLILSSNLRSIVDDAWTWAQTDAATRPADDNWI
jgi:hypothetical protein